MVEQAGDLSWAALNQAVDAVIFIDQSNCISYFNPAAERMFGYDRAEVLGHNVRILVPAELRDTHDRLVDASRRAGDAGIVNLSREVPIARKDGSRIWGQLSLSRAQVGDCVNYAAFIRNVTEEVASRTELYILSLVANETDRVVMVTDGQMRIIYVNRAFTQLFGYSREEISGQSPLAFLVREFGDAAIENRLRQKVRERAPFSEELLCRNKADGQVWVSAAISPVYDRERNELRNIVAVLTDITESKQIDTLQREVLAAVTADVPLTHVAELICRKVEAILPGVVCSIMSVSKDGRLHPLAAPSLPDDYVAALEGIPVGPSVGSCGTAAFRGEPVAVTDIAASPLWNDYRHLPLPPDLVACWSIPVKTRTGQVAGTFALYFRERRAPGPWHEHIMDRCVPLCALAMERSEAEDQIARLSSLDALTGLPNRSRLLETLASTMAEVSQTGETVVCLILDVDHFKDVNDTLGHSTGDQILLEFARRLTVQLRGADMVARIGGDEFAVLLRGCAAEEAALIAERLLEVLSTAPVAVQGLHLTMSASIGIAIYPLHAADAETVLKHADAALYEAKRDGRGKFHFFTEDLNVKAQSRLVLGVALREAILHRQLRLVFQPQVSIKSGALHGVEALTRWSDPVHGEVPAPRFIALAEEYGLIESIDHWAIEETCRLIPRWRAKGLDVPHVSVNVSPVSFRSSAVLDVIAKSLEDNGLQPADLRVEITERVMMDQHPNSLNTARAIEAMGVHLAMDDFGTGYSSLSSLAQLPIAELKIDRSFMLALEEDANAQALATAVIRIGHSLGMTVVAEGVETKAQLDLLGELNCHAAQGFLFARPLEVPEFEDWLRQRSLAH